jgi:hypothetical protein
MRAPRPTPDLFAGSGEDGEDGEVGEGFVMGGVGCVGSLMAGLSLEGEGEPAVARLRIRGSA